MYTGLCESFLLILLSLQFHLLLFPRDDDNAFLGDGPLSPSSGSSRPPRSPSKPPGQLFNSQTQRRRLRTTSLSSAGELRYIP